MIHRTYPGLLQLRSILIASDFSPASDKALRHALRIARSFDAELTLLHVVPPSLGSTICELDGVGEAINQSLEIASGIERRLLYSGAIGDVRYRSIVRAGNVWSEVLQVVRQESIDLVVVGTHARTGIRRTALGSIAEQIFRQAPCPVLTIGPGAAADAQIGRDKPLQPLLFVTDFTEASVAALPLAASIAERRHSQLILAHMISSEHLISGIPLNGEAPVLRTSADAQQTAMQRLRQLAETVELISEPALVAEFADPAPGILKVAAETRAEAIVMGLGRKRYIEEHPHLRWSIAYEVVRHARCPVLTVRTYSP